MGIDFRLVDHKQEVLNAKDGQVALALDAVGKAVLWYVDALVPKDTGNLANSMTHVVQGDAVIVGTDVKYGKYVEFNEKATHKPPTQAHFLRDSVQQHLGEYKALAEKYLSR